MKKADLERRIMELERRVADLEARPPLQPTVIPQQPAPTYPTYPTYPGWQPIITCGTGHHLT